MLVLGMRGPGERFYKREKKVLVTRGMVEDGKRCSRFLIKCMLYMFALAIWLSAQAHSP